VLPPSVLTCHCKLLPVVVAVKLVFTPEQIDALVGLVLITGTAVTVNTALLELTAGVQLPDIVKRYLLLFIDATVGLTVSVPEVTPLYGAVLVRLAHVLPPSVLTCHCKPVPVPVPFAVKEADVVSHTVVLTGLLVTAGKALTVKVPAKVAIGEQVPVPVNLYLLPLITGVTALMVSVAVFAPA
jgi:hypothetical protein